MTSNWENIAKQTSYSKHETLNIYKNTSTLSHIVLLIEAINTCVNIVPTTLLDISKTTSHNKIHFNYKIH